MIFKYRNIDGKGKCYSGKSKEDVLSLPFCVQVFGPLERPLERDERINPVDGSIEKIPLTQAAIQDRADAQALRAAAALSAAEFDALAQAEVKKLLRLLLRHQFKRGD